MLLYVVSLSSQVRNPQYNLRPLLINPHSLFRFRLAVEIRLRFISLKTPQNPFIPLSLPTSRETISFLLGPYCCSELVTRKWRFPGFCLEFWLLPLLFSVAYSRLYRLSLFLRLPHLPAMVSLPPLLFFFFFYCCEILWWHVRIVSDLNWSNHVFFAFSFLFSSSRSVLIWKKNSWIWVEFHFKIVGKIFT